MVNHILRGRARLTGDERLPYKFCAFEIYRKAYQSIGLQYADADSLFSDTHTWDVAWNEYGSMVAILAYKQTSHGLKGVVIASDGSTVGRKFTFTLMEELNTFGHYAELSGRPESIAHKLNISVVCANVARKLVSHPIVSVAGGKAYLRPIAGIGTRRKVMFGKPKVS